MVMPKRGKILDKFEPKSLQECLGLPYKPITVAAELFLTKEECSVVQMAKHMGISRTNARIQLDFLLKHKLVYLHRWDKTHSHNWTAMFKAGDKPHAAPPSMKNALAIKKPEPAPPPPKPLTVSEAEAAEQLAYLKELAVALVPQRSANEQYEVNWKYWHHISGEAA